MGNRAARHVAALSALLVISLAACANHPVVGTPLAVAVRAYLRPPTARASFAERVSAEILLDGKPSPDTVTAVTYNKGP